MCLFGIFQILLAIQECFSELGLVRAGGLGPKTMRLAALLIKVFRDLMSLDAQGKLRRSGSARDPIEWDMGEEYLRQAFLTCYT